MERARRVGVKAASLHSIGVFAPQPRQIREGAAWLGKLVLQGCHRTRRIHHSAGLQGFYTNRLYKKRCARCGRPNIVPMTRCGYCDEVLTDEDIRPVGRDVLKELAASRTHHHSRINLFSECADVRTSMTSGLSSEKTYTGKFHGTLHLPCSREASAPVRGNLIYSLFTGSRQPHRSKEDAKTRNAECMSPFVPMIQQSSIIEYYRSFDFLIMRYPFPVAAVHLSAVVKGTVYDVKQLRPSHVPLLQQMQRQTAAVVEDILQENEVLLGGRTTCKDVNDERARCARGGRRRFPVNIPVKATFDKDFISSTGGSKTEDAQEGTRVFTYKESQKQRELVSKAIEKLKSCMILGFTYPCEYNQVNMHAIVPPIFNFNMMKAPFFLPLKKVLQDLKETGYVQVNERSAKNTALSRDVILEEAQLVDASVRRLLGFRANVSI
eukprot:XP_028343224.1 uncharacterized protein LOC114485632 [Physeter catodon]